MSSNDLLELKGSVEHILFRNEMNGYTVIELYAKGENVTVVGIMPFINVGEELVLVGRWKTHVNFGLQFCVEKFERYMPTTSDSILKYLSSGAIRGVGKVIAQRLVQKFKGKTLDVIENDAERLTQVQGITLAKAQRISQDFKRVFGIRDLMAYMEQFLVTPQESVRIWQALGENSLEIVKEDPYVICRDDILISFDKADLISEALNFSNNDRCRLKAGINHVILHNMNNGHTCLPSDKLCEAVAQFLNVNVVEILDTLQSIKIDGELAFNEFDGRVFVLKNQMYICESYLAGRLLMMKNFAAKPIAEIDNEIALIEEKYQIKYAAMQKKAIIDALSKGILILTGGPGTGKTTTLNAIIKILRKKRRKGFSRGAYRESSSENDASYRC